MELGNEQNEKKSEACLRVIATTTFNFALFKVVDEFIYGQEKISRRVSRVF